jgi:hypothetical protein
MLIFAGSIADRAVHQSFLEAQLKPLKIRTMDTKAAQESGAKAGLSRPVERLRRLEPLQARRN